MKHKSLPSAHHSAPLHIHVKDTVFMNGLSSVRHRWPNWSISRMLVLSIRNSRGPCEFVRCWRCKLHRCSGSPAGHTGGASCFSNSEPDSRMFAAVCALGSVGIIVLAASESKSILLTSAIPQFLGRIPYSLYLTHMTVSVVLCRLLNSYVGFSAIAGVLSILFARPFQQRRVAP